MQCPQGHLKTIGHFGKYHNTLCLSPQILHKHCFQFLLGLTTVPRENNNAYAKFGGQKKSIMVFSEVAYSLRKIWGEIKCIVGHSKIENWIFMVISIW